DPGRPDHGRRLGHRRGRRPRARRARLRGVRDGPPARAAAGGRRRGRRARRGGRHGRSRPDRPRGGRGRRALRPPRRARLRGGDRGGGDRGRAVARVLERRPGHEPDRRLPGLPRRAAPPRGGPRRRRDRLVARRAAGRAGVGGLRRLEGRAHHAHAVHRRRLRAPGGARELRVPRLDPHADGRRGDAGPGAPRGRRRAGGWDGRRLRARHAGRPGPQAGYRRGGGGDRRVARVGRVLLRQRRGAHRRRRRVRGRRRHAGVPI
ncbi:MAG: 3-oxoacyl-[acyl-carrier protein] reductase, partial [uncultured Solirubrobacteraceae bacterium]